MARVRTLAVCMCALGAMLTVRSFHSRDPSGLDPSPIAPCGQQRNGEALRQWRRRARRKTTTAIVLTIGSLPPERVLVAAGSVMRGADMHLPAASFAQWRRPRDQISGDRARPLEGALAAPEAGPSGIAGEGAPLCARGLQWYVASTMCYPLALSGILPCSDRGRVGRLRFLDCSLPRAWGGPLRAVLVCAHWPAWGLLSWACRGRHRPRMNCELCFSVIIGPVPSRQRR